LEEDHAGVPLKISPPVVAYRETVQGTTPMETGALSKSPNKHNRIFMKAMPLDEELCIQIEAGKISPRDELKARARVLADNFGMNFSSSTYITVY